MAKRRAKKSPTVPEDAAKAHEHLICDLVQALSSARETGGTVELMVRIVITPPDVSRIVNPAHDELPLLAARVIAERIRHQTQLLIELASGRIAATSDAA